MRTDKCESYCVGTSVDCSLAFYNVGSSIPHSRFFWTDEADSGSCS
jgi:hypothetical protein